MMTAEKTTGFGVYLRNQRRAKDIPIETVSQKTKIRVEVLRHIENEDMGRLPSSTFVKGFVRAYAEAVGADIDEALRLFEASCVSHIECDLIGVPQKERSHFWRSLFLVCLVLILLVLISLSIARRMENRPPATTPPEMESIRTSSPTEMQAEMVTPAPAAGDQKPFTQEADVTVTSTTAASHESPQPALATVEEPAPADADANATAPVLEDAAQPQPERLVLQISAVELTWLRVTSDRQVVKEMTLKPDERMIFEAERRFDLVIGNAGGVQLTLNDKALGFPGKRGKVISLQLP